MSKKETFKVFTPSQPAKLTFVDRDIVNKQLVNSLRTPGKQIVVYGYTGSGKTTLLTNKINQLYEGYIPSQCTKGTTIDQLKLEAFDYLNKYYISETTETISSGISASLKTLYSEIKAESKVQSGTKIERIVPIQLTDQRLAEFVGEAKCCWKIEDFHKQNIKLKIIGIKNFSKKLNKHIDLSEKKKSKNTKLQINLALNYGSKFELVNAFRKLNKNNEKINEKNLTKSNIIELENHLIDLIDDLESKGLNEEESFIIAKKRIGKTEDICLEFDKINSNFSFINNSIPYIKGALIYISFINLSKLFLVTTLLLSKKLNIDEVTFNIISIILLFFALISFFSTIYFKRGKRVLSKLSNANVLVTLIIISSLILYRLSAAVPLPVIEISTIENPIANFYTLELNFGIYKMLSGLIILTTSLVFFWKNKKENKLKYTK